MMESLKKRACVPCLCPGRLTAAAAAVLALGLILLKKSRADWGEGTSARG